MPTIKTDVVFELELNVHYDEEAHRLVVHDAHGVTLRAYGRDVVKDGVVTHTLDEGVVALTDLVRDAALIESLKAADIVRPTILGGGLSQFFHRGTDDAAEAVQLLL